MDWVALVTAIIAAISNKRRNQSAETIERQLRNPGWHERTTCKQVIRERLDLTGSDLRRATREAMSKLRSASDGQITALMAASEGMYRAQPSQDVIDEILGN